MTYWIDLFTGTTWDEFRKAGANVSGFSAKQKVVASKIKPGDFLLCYLTGVMHWVGALEVIGPSKDKRNIWSGGEYPVRFDVKPLIVLPPEHGLPMEELKGKVDFYGSASDKGKFKGFVRSSPRAFKREEDGDFILEKLRAAEKSPVTRPVSAKKLGYTPFVRAERVSGTKKMETIVSIPDRDEPAEVVCAVAGTEEDQVAGTQHTEIQHHLLSLGADMGLNVWVARNDRSKTWNGKMLGTCRGNVTDLPTQFNEATNRTIELIDVLWLKGNSIVAAFEVECTTSVYSGLLRMSDLLALQPNLNIKLYLVAPDERKKKVEQEIIRPTFKLRERPLSEICGFIPFSDLLKKVKGIQELGLAKSLKPEFLDSLAIYFNRRTTEEESPKVAGRVVDLA